eukprot:sb/3469499/
MNRRHVDEQSVVTYLVSLNKAVGEMDVPDLAPEIIAHTAAVSAASCSDSQFIEEEEEEEEEEVSIQLEELTVDGLDDDLTPIGDPSLPQIVAVSEREVYSAASAVSTTEEVTTVSPDTTEEDKDSGLDLEYPQVLPQNKNVEVLRADDVTSPRSSTVTLDSESEYASAASSPMSYRKLPPDSLGLTDDDMKTLSSSDIDTPNVESVEDLEITLNFLTSLPDHVSERKT